MRAGHGALDGAHQSTGHPGDRPELGAGDVDVHSPGAGETAPEQAGLGREAHDSRDLSLSGSVVVDEITDAVVLEGLGAHERPSGPGDEEAP